MKKIFLVEDEKSLSNLLVSYLVNAEYDVTPFYDGLLAKKAIIEEPDLWVLDIMLPGIDGYALIKEIKSNNPECPVIFMSARSAELDRVLGLEMGSDDYLPKPFLPRELVLRVNRLLKKNKTSLSENKILLGSCIFNRQKRIILSNDEETVLTVKEYDILEFLISNKGKAVGRTEIIDTVWGTDYFGSERVVDDTLRRLRKKVPELPLEAVYGYGYILKIK
ncbi:response regulator transcription factor [Clostridium grantii]|uniref:Stage 0 sporulation protein A homolog n=1 Tax=Clostridium grantii DSM 8605 TaxID=1121316 RepID=A0A1M5X000_9CLOT|nr:response regulator transcription factor [Clostridium grantii]SHH93111.1 two-component system, OmpR family, response regulator CssR [Clostridium grantii DSM 8605]